MTPPLNDDSQQSNVQESGQIEMLSVAHPKHFLISGMHFEVVSNAPLSDEQASKIAMIFFLRKNFEKSDEGKLFQVNTQIS